MSDYKYRVILRQKAKEQEKDPNVQISDRCREIFYFCKTPKTATEIAEQFQMTMNAVYKRICVLRKGSYLDRLGNYNREVKFVATNRIIDPEARKVMAKQMVMGVRL